MTSIKLRQLTWWGSEVRTVTLKNGECLIGGNSADLTLRDANCSDRHAVIVLIGEKLRVRDLDTKNGTFVDGKRIFESPLKVGNEIRIGNTIFHLLAVSREPLPWAPECHLEKTNELSSAPKKTIKLRGSGL